MIGIAVRHVTIKITWPKIPILDLICCVT